MSFATAEREELFDEEYETDRTPESYDRERDVEHGEDENDFEDAQPVDAESFDSGSIAAAEAAGGMPDDWEKAGAGSDGWIFDGEKIFNPTTGESYGGHSPEAEVRHREAIRHLEEGGGTYFHESTWREETAEGTVISTIHLVFGEADKAGIRAVGWEMHTMQVPRSAEDDVAASREREGTRGYDRSYAPDYARDSESEPEDAIRDGVEAAASGHERVAETHRDHEQEKIHSLLERLLHVADEEEKEACPNAGRSIPETDMPRGAGPLFSRTDLSLEERLLEGSAARGASSNDNRHGTSAPSSRHGITLSRLAA